MCTDICRSTWWHNLFVIFQITEAARWGALAPPVHAPDFLPAPAPSAAADHVPAAAAAAHPVPVADDPGSAARNQGPVTGKKS